VEDSEEVRQAAIALLARREHSRRELEQKLRQRGAGEELIAEALDALAAEGLQSDARYTESFITARRARGFGALRIRAQLRERGVDDVLIEHHMSEMADCLEQLEEVRRKRFGPELPKDFKEQARQSRFLQYRGFSAEQIRRLFRTEWD
jgi:regulatory protein